MSPKLEDQDKDDEQAAGSRYKAIQKVVKMLRAGSYTYQQMLDTLTQADLDKETAENLMERLMTQVDDE